MLISKSYLQKIILEEINKVIYEQVDIKEAKDAFYVKMPPQKFLELAAKDVVSCEDRVSKFKDKTFDPTGLRGFPSLKLDILQNKIIDHEGRGRACLAISNKLSDITVYISFYKDGRKVISSWEKILNKQFIINQDGDSKVDITKINAIEEPPDWFRRLRIYAVTYIDLKNPDAGEETQYNFNRLTIDTPLIRQDNNLIKITGIYRLKPNKEETKEGPYKLDSNGYPVISDKNVNNADVWEKIEKSEWDKLPAHQK